MTLCSLAAALCGAGQGAFAHTTIRDQALEGTTAYNAIQIEHGCELDNGKKYPIIAQSVVFPTVNPIVTRSDGTATTLGQEISNPAGLAGLADLVQDKNIFQAQQKKYDANGNLIGFYGVKGNLQTNLLGVLPFQFTAVNFLPSSCAKRLFVQIAIADICKSTFPPKPGTANLWIPQAIPSFKDSTNEGIGNPAVLTINRDLTNNKLPASCGAGYDVTVAPSIQDMNTNLRLKGWGK